MHTSAKSLCALALVAALGLSSCLSNQAYTEKMSSALATCQIVLIVPQNDLEVVVAQSGGDGSLLGALVSGVANAVRLEKAQKAAAPILEELVDYNVGQQSAVFLAEALQQSPFAWDKNPPLIESDDSLLKTIYAESNADAVLFIRLRQTLEGRLLRMSWAATMLPKSEALRPFMTNTQSPMVFSDDCSIFRNQYYFSSKGVKPSTIRAKLDEGLNTLAERIARELSSPIK